jgi:hypothetical protein
MKYLKVTVMQYNEWLRISIIEKLASLGQHQAPASVNYVDLLTSP